MKKRDFFLIFLGSILIYIAITKININLKNLIIFIYKFVGPTSIILIPMLIFTMSVLLILGVGGKEDITEQVKKTIIKCHFLAPLLGILGTLIGFMGGTLGFKHGFNMHTVGSLIVNTGQGIGSTLLGLVLYGILTLILEELE